MGEPKTHILKICDFGTAKLPGEEEETHQCYLCSRFYRAPELILSARASPAVDLWSAGCIILELIRGHVVFQGKDGADQLLQIMEICGTPSPQDLYAMNPMFDAEVAFVPRVEAVPWYQ